jgi:hypothetical protein
VNDGFNPGSFVRFHALAMADFANLDHSTLQPEAIAVTFVFPVLATIAVGLRLYSRSLMRTFGYGIFTPLASSFPSHFGLQIIDDWFICVAAVSTARTHLGEPH